MNRKGIAPLLIIAVIIVAALGILGFLLFPNITSALSTQCNEMETGFGLDTGNSVWQNICVEPNSAEMQATLAAYGYNSQQYPIPEDAWSVWKLTCQKNPCFLGMCWGNPSVETVKTCSVGETCTASGQNADCTGQANTGQCNNNGTCDSWENFVGCPGDCTPPEK
ncbi:MAG TPA: hypothetical protein VI977_00705 [archaeon]|nr:hypothetical protein [archaeon]